MIFSVRAYSASFFLQFHSSSIFFVRSPLSLILSVSSVDDNSGRFWFAYRLAKLETRVRLPNFIATGCFDFANSFTKRPAQKRTLSLELLLFECGHGGVTHFALRSFVLNHQHSIQLCKYFTVFFFCISSLSLDLAFTLPNGLRALCFR